MEKPNILNINWFILFRVETVLDVVEWTKSNLSPFAMFKNYGNMS